MVNYKPLEDYSLVTSTCLQGYVDATFKELEDKFGEPNEGDGYKVDAEWTIQFDDGTIATIYNYKDGINYNGTSGTPASEITHWHIGGTNSQAVKNVHKALGKE